MTRARKPPWVPPARDQTERRALMDCLRQGPVSLGALSSRMGLPEKRLQAHLEQLRDRPGFAMVPARCGDCGFEFQARRRTRKPGKCPNCRGTRIEAPLYVLDSASRDRS